jgi:hypothetical protein
MPMTHELAGKAASGSVQFKSSHGEDVGDGVGPLGGVGVGSWFGPSQELI